MVGGTGDQLQPGVEDGGTPTEDVAEKTRKSKKKQKTRKQENTPTKKMVGEHWGQGIPSPHLIHGILWQEWVVISYNQEKKMVGHLQKLQQKKTRKSPQKGGP